MSEGRYSNWSRRFREICEEAARQFCMLHPELEFAQSETGIPEPGWVVVRQDPQWGWRQQYGETGFYSFGLILTDDWRGIWLHSYLRDGPEREARSLRPGNNSERYIFWNGLTYDRTDESAIGEVVSRLEEILAAAEALVPQPPTQTVQPIG